MRADLTHPSRFREWLGGTVVRVDDALREIEVRYQPREEAANRYGTLAGGVLAAMLDSLTGLAALAVLPEQAVAVHRSLSVEYLRPTTPGPIRGIARMLERDERMITCEGELFDASGTLVARGHAELQIILKTRVSP
jgi:uncharacterized protein (TIGR00369 family)